MIIDTNFLDTLLLYAKELHDPEIQKQLIEKALYLLYEEKGRNLGQDNFHTLSTCLKEHKNASNTDEINIPASNVLIEHMDELSMLLDAYDEGDSETKAKIILFLERIHPGTFCYTERISFNITKETISKKEYISNNFPDVSYENIKNEVELMWQELK